MKIVFGIAAMAAIVMASQAVPSLAGSDNSEYVIVANKQLQGSSINLTTLKGIYLREVRKWGNNMGDIVPVDLDSEQSFYQNLFGKSHSQMQAYWLNMRIKYSIELPISRKDSEGVKQFIAENRGAIGYIRSSDVDDRVKVLKLVE